MKKIALLAFCAFSSINYTFSQSAGSVARSGFVAVPAAEQPAAREASAQIPALLQGIWQGSDRLVLFAPPEDDFAVVLRVFYGWYDDRAAEPASYAERSTRPRNDATVRDAEHISVSYRTVFENASKTAGVYELVVSYPGIREPSVVPVCVVGDSLYLDCMIRDSARLTDAGAQNAVEGTAGFWRSASNADGIKIAAPVLDTEVRSYFVADDGVYYIRYWESGMDYSYDSATFSDGENVFAVDKFLRIGDRVYQCTTGRSTKIRNIAKAESLPAGVAFDSDGQICALGEPYLVRVPDSAAGGADTLTQLVASHNERRRPPPKPLFPPAQINFHWKEIDELRQYSIVTWNKRNLDIHK